VQVFELIRRALPRAGFLLPSIPHDPEKPAPHSMRGGNRFSEKDRAKTIS
jgi:hypothetical protein